MDKRYITLKNLLIGQEKCIGLKFFADKVVQALINGFPGLRYSEEYAMNYIANTPANLNLIFKTFRGVAWINCGHFFPRSTFGKEKKSVDVQELRNRLPIAGKKFCPESYLGKLELKCYARNTVRTYVSCFEAFINHYAQRSLEELNENDIRLYLQLLIRKGCSTRRSMPSSFIMRWCWKCPTASTQWNAPELRKSCRRCWPKRRCWG